MPLPEPSGAHPGAHDHAWSIMLAQLARATQARPEPPRAPRDRRYAIEVLERATAGPARPRHPDPALFDAISCLLVACSRLGRRVAVRQPATAGLGLTFATRDSAARVMGQLAPVLASCNARLRAGPWEVVLSREDAH